MESFAPILMWIATSFPAFLFFGLGFYFGHRYSNKNTLFQKEMYEKQLSFERERNKELEAKNYDLSKAYVALDAKHAELERRHLFNLVETSL